MNKKFFIISYFFVLIFFIIFLSVFIFFDLYPQKYVSIIKKYAKEYDISPALVASVINVESGYKKEAISPVGAVGLMQIMPQTAKWIEGDVNLKDVNTNIKVGCKYLAYLKTQFSSFECVIASYNAGPNKVKIWLNNKDFSTDGINLKTTPYKETNEYIKKVKKNLKVYNLFYK